MMSAGQLLYSERTRRNRSLAEIASETRISARYLEAIEQDDIKALPGDFFYNAFLRQYAQSLELDQATTDRIVASAVPSEEIDPLPALSEAYVQARQGGSSRWSPSTAVALGALVLVLAGGSGLYAWWQRVQNQKEAAADQAASIASPVTPVQPEQRQQLHQQQQEQQQAATPLPSESTTPVLPSDTASLPAGSASPEQTALSQSASRPAAESPAPASSVPQQPLGTGNMALELVATEPAWVQLSSGGKTLYIGVLQPAQARQFAVAENARLLTGNAGALDVRINGKPMGALGPKGQVRTVYFSNNSFQIAPPRPRVTTTGEAAAASPTTASVAIRPPHVAH